MTLSILAATPGRLDSRRRRRIGGTNGGFQLDRDINCKLLLRDGIRNRFWRRGARVGCPFVGQPRKVTDGRPPAVLPPCGWSTGFIATPRTVGRRPSQRERPAFPGRSDDLGEVATLPRLALLWAGILR